MRRRFLTTLFLVCIIGIYTVFAQEPTLSKQEAVALALENHFGIQVARNQVEIAD